jgi:hypothetical protein
VRQRLARRARNRDDDEIGPNALDRLADVPARAENGQPLDPHSLLRGVVVEEAEDGVPRELAKLAEERDPDVPAPTMRTRRAPAVPRTEVRNFLDPAARRGGKPR